MYLDIDRDTIGRLIDLAREFHAQEQVVIPEDPANPSGDWATQILAAHAGDATLDEFRSIVRDLEPDQQQQLVALFWVGREDYAAEEWADALEAAADAAVRPVADYLIGHPILAEYLQAGLDALDEQE